MNIFANIFKSTPISKEQILNAGLSMAMEFGSNWLQPINERLRSKFPNLSEQELKEYNTLCQSAMKRGHNYIYDTLNMLAENDGTIRSIELQDQFKLSLRSEYDWINDKNITGLYSQGCYYAWKDGLDNAIVN